MDGYSKDIVKEDIEKLRSIFPQCVVDGKVKIDQLLNILGEYEERDFEKYEFTWKGKNECYKVARERTKATLLPCESESVNFNDTENLYIEGDNLEVLKVLQQGYYNKIKMIYIDPPYNTGNDFVYKDNYKNSLENYKNTVSSIGKSNPETSGRFHTDWLNMMFPRLMLAHTLLKDDGIIFISIDDNEVDNLKKMCNEVFGESNFINLITIKTKIAGVSGSYLGKSLQNNSEYLLMYCKNIEKFNIDNTPIKKQELYSFIKSMEDEGRSWKYTSVIKEIDEGEYIKSIQAGNGEEIKIFKHKKFNILSLSKVAKDEFQGDLKKAYYIYKDKIFRTTNAQSSIRTRVIEETKDLDFEVISIDYVPTKGKNIGQLKKMYFKDKKCNLITFLSDVCFEENNRIYKKENKGTFWDDINYNNLNNEAGLIFPNGQKPILLIKSLINMFNFKENDIILDFFSGSSTTAHAVMRLNAEDGGNRKYIMVQLPQLCDEKTEAYKNGYKNICEIGKERIRRAGAKIKEEMENTENLDTGFRVFKLDSTNFNRWNVPLFEDIDINEYLNNVKEILDDRTEVDAMFEILIKNGFPLTEKIYSLDIDNYKFYHIGKDCLVLVSFEENIPIDVIEQAIEYLPAKLILTMSAFEDTSAMVTAKHIINKDYSIQFEILGENDIN